MSKGEGIHKEYEPSEELAAVIGSDPISRPQLMKKIWKYIKKHDLQNPKNKREILANHKLQKVFDGKKKVSMFEMTKLLGEHLK